MSAIRSVKLLNGCHMPLFGLGTWQSTPEEVIRAVETAIDVGYRHIDTAYAYSNEESIGKALKNKMDAGVVKREDLFITTKLHVQFLHKEDVKPSVQKSLKALGLSYIDLYLIHAPVGFQKGDTLFPVTPEGQPMMDNTVDHVDVWKGMEGIYNEGLVKAIGLSNFNSKQIKHIYDNASVKPMNLQVECHPHFRQIELHKFCSSLNITFTAYAPLGSPNRASNIPGMKKGAELAGPLSDPVILGIAEKHNKTAAQVCLRYLVQRDIVVIPKSVTPARIQQNYNIWDFSLTSAEMNEIESISTNERSFNSPFLPAILQPVNSYFNVSLMLLDFLEAHDVA